MSGFEVANVAVLEFEAGGPLDGCVARATLELPLRTFFAFQRLVGAGLTFDPEAMDDAMLDRWESALRFFGDKVLLAWNLKRDGEPVPPSGDAMVTLHFPLAVAMFNAWSSALVAPDSKPAAASESGEPLEAEPAVTAPV